MRQANQDIRRSLAANGIRHWELAKAMGIGESTLCKYLRTEQSPGRKKEMLDNIAFLAELKNKEEEA